MSRNALVVGINSYQRLNPLKTPAEDAEAVARMLERHGDFHVLRLHAVKDEANPSGRMSRKAPVSQAQLEDALVQLFTPEGRNIPDTALLFFSGHGLRRDRRVYHEGYLSVSEADRNEKWGISLQWLRRLLEESPVKQQIIWLDCCHAGELLNFDEANPGSRGAVRDRCFIAASREYEAAYEETSEKHGLLTAALLSALDPVRQAGEVTNYAVCDYLSGHLRSTIQQPVFTNFGGPIFLTFANRGAIRTGEKADVICPYKGLEYFDFRGKDPEFFHGRQELTDQLLERVREGNFLAVLGPSGSGKSSVVRAGLIHRLRAGDRLSGSDHWTIITLKPITSERAEIYGGVSDDPLENLAWAFVSPVVSDTERAVELSNARTLIRQGTIGLADLIRVRAGAGRVVMLIDQFEEAFTLCADREKRQAFFETLLGTLPILGRTVCLIVTMRADFFSKCAEADYGGLAGLIQDHLVTVTPLSNDELRQAIVEPAKKAGLQVQEELIRQMVEDVKESPGSLPLLQYTLTELWKEREGDELTLSAYTRMGSVKGTLARRADDVYEGLDPAEQKVAKRIFLKLTHLGEGTEDTRRQVSRQSLIPTPESAPIVDRVIQRLSEARLIVTGEVQAKGREERVPVIDVAHEALIRHWPRLRIWLDENRDQLRFESRLAEAVQHWMEHGKHENLLWRPPDLDSLEAFHEVYGDGMSPNQREFLTASLTTIDLEEKEKAAARQREIDQVQRTQALLASNYWASGINAKKQNRCLEERHYMALCAETTTKSSLAINCVFDIQQGFYPTLVFRFGNRVKAAKFNHDETRILTWGVDGTARLWNAQNGVSVGQPMKHEGRVSGAAYNKDETRILTWSSDGTARLWNAQNGVSVGQPMKHEGRVSGTEYNKCETRILTWSDDGTARLWNAKNGGSVGQPLKHESSVSGTAFNKDETRILTWSSDGTARLWYGENGDPVGSPMRHKSSVSGAAYNKDETRILTWSSDGTARLWNAQNGVSVGQPMKHENSVSGAAFNNKETRILTWSSDGTARLWDGENGAPVGQLMKHENGVFGATFNKDETRILTWGCDDTVGFWNAKSGAPLGPPMKHKSVVYGASFNQDATRILTWSNDGTARLWNTENGTPVGLPMKHESLVRSAGFNKNETRILTWGDDDMVGLWNAENGTPLGLPMKHESRVIGAVFNKNETRIITCSADGTASLWNAENDKPVEITMKHESSVISATFNKDESLILTWSSDGTARLWSVENNAPVGLPMKHEAKVRGAAFNRNETRILTWSNDGTARLWNTQNGMLIGQPMKHESSVYNAAFNIDETRIITWSSDGTVFLWNAENCTPIGLSIKHETSVSCPVLNENRILTWSADGTVRLWNTENGGPVGQPMKHENGVRGAAFNRDKTLILTWSNDETARLWNAENGMPVGQPMKHENIIRGAAFSRDQKLILTWSDDETARLWNAENGEPVGQPMKHDFFVIGAVFNKDETIILTWSLDHTARLWKAENGEPVGQPMKHNDDIWGAKFNKDESLILTNSLDGTARLWKAENGEPVGQPMKHGFFVGDAIFNIDDTRVLTWDGEGTARLWDAENGAPVGQPMKHSFSVNGVAYSKDELRILTWSGDGTARLWNIGADYDFPQKYLPLLVEVATATQMDIYGNITSLTTEVWEKKKQEYIAVVEAHLKDCEYLDYNLYFHRQKQFWKP